MSINPTEHKSPTGFIIPNQFVLLLISGDTDQQHLLGPTEKLRQNPVTAMPYFK
jgi:hypothetical protein